MQRDVGWLEVRQRAYEFRQLLVYTVHLEPDKRRNLPSVLQKRSHIRKMCEQALSASLQAMNLVAMETETIVETVWLGGCLRNQLLAQSLELIQSFQLDPISGH